MCCCLRKVSDSPAAPESCTRKQNSFSDKVKETDVGEGRRKKLPSSWQVKPSGKVAHLPSDLLGVARGKHYFPIPQFPQKKFREEERKRGYFYFDFSLPKLQLKTAFSLIVFQSISHSGTRMSECSNVQTLLTQSPLKLIPCIFNPNTEDCSQLKTACNINNVNMEGVKFHRVPPLHKELQGTADCWKN